MAAPNRDTLYETMGYVLWGEAAGMELDEAALADLKGRIRQARSITYLTDNCGEVVLDKLLIAQVARENPQAQVTAVVRGVPGRVQRGGGTSGPHGQKVTRPRIQACGGQHWTGRQEGHAPSLSGDVPLPSVTQPDRTIFLQQLRTSDPLAFTASTSESTSLAGRLLRRLCDSPRAEFAVVYGRRRVGKTFLVREFFGSSFAFYATGVAGGKANVQLASFNDALLDIGAKSANDWFEAFRNLREALESEQVKRDGPSGKRVVFIDELPWLDAPRTDFLVAFELFWNRWASAQRDILLIACGSAASWVVKKLFKNRSGLHNRVTARIHLQPLTLAECEAYYRTNGYVFSREQMLEGYMVFGGIPYYLDLMSQRQSLVQNIDRLCFARDGELRGEFDELYWSLFKHADRHIAIVRALAGRQRGRTQQEIAQMSGIALGGTLVGVLDDLEASGFIRRYFPFGKQRRGSLYQLVDPFSLFYLRFMDKGSPEGFWADNHRTPHVNAWRGYAFELVCLLHERQVIRTLGISALASDASSWRSSTSDPGTQVDLVLDRTDGIIDLCEMKWSTGEYAISKTYGEQLRNKAQAFMDETQTHKAVHIALVTSSGLARNAYADVVQSVLKGDDLFVG